jgi:septum formation protein
VIVSGVDEEIEAASTESLVLTLAENKATEVAYGIDDGVVIGCDSLLEVGGKRHGKPESIDIARQYWHEMAGKTATLMTGHCIFDRPSDRVASAVIKTKVTFGRPTPSELERYFETSESLYCAGGFTLEGFGSSFVESVNGDALNVMGLSPATIRRLLLELGIPLTTLWLSGER